MSKVETVVTVINAPKLDSDYEYTGDFRIPKSNEMYYCFKYKAVVFAKGVSTPVTPQLIVRFKYGRLKDHVDDIKIDGLTIGGPEIYKLKNYAELERAIPKGYVGTRIGIPREGEYYLSAGSLTEFKVLQAIGSEHHTGGSIRIRLILEKDQDA